MKTPSDLLTGIQTRGDFRELRERASQERPLTSDSGLPPQHPIWDVWNQIKSAYPGPTANWEAEPPMIWAYAIDGLSPEQVAQGVRNLVYRDSEFPPSAGQFREMCQMDMDWEHKRLKYYQANQLLERKRTAEENAQGLANIREIMGKI